MSSTPCVDCKHDNNPCRTGDDRLKQVLNYCPWFEIKLEIKEMFKVEQCRSYKIVNEQNDFLHSDGSILPRGEFWPTREQAQAVLDKYQPTHVWEHGDVFTAGFSHYNLTLVYLVIKGKPEVFNLFGPIDGSATNMSDCLDDATFLFNIKDKL